MTHLSYSGRQTTVAHSVCQNGEEKKKGGEKQLITTPGILRRSRTAPGIPRRSRPKHVQNKSADGSV